MEARAQAIRAVRDHRWQPAAARLGRGGTGGWLGPPDL